MTEIKDVTVRTSDIYSLPCQIWDIYQGFYSSECYINHFTFAFKCDFNLHIPFD